LPDIAAQQRVSLDNPMTRLALYRMFIKKWFERGEQKLASQGNLDKIRSLDPLTNDSKKVLNDFCKRLTLDMYKQKVML
jgi:hypothetical protein